MATRTEPVSSPQGELSAAVVWGTVALLWVAYFLNYTDRQVVFSIFPALKTELGFSDTELGLIGSLFTWVYSLCMIASGRAADVFRRDRLIIISLLLWSIATLGTSTSTSVPSFLGWRVVMGITESLYVPAALSLIASIHGPRTRSRALGIHMTAQILGITAGGSYGGWAADHIGWRAGFVVLSCLGIVYSLVLFAGFRKLPNMMPAKTSSRRASGGVFRSVPYNLLLLVFFAYCIMLWMLYAWLPNFIYERFHISMSESGFLATAYLQGSTAIGILSGAFFGDFLSVRVPGIRFYLVGFGVVLAAPFAWVAFGASSLTILKLGSIGFGYFAGWLMSNIFAASYDVVEKENYGVAGGVLNVFGGLAGGTAIFFAGYWKQTIGISTLMVGASIAAALSGLLLIGYTWRSRIAPIQVKAA